MILRPVLVASLLGLLAHPAPSGKSMKKDDTLPVVEPQRMKVTQGKLEPLPDGRLVIDSPKVRAVAPSQGEPKTRALVAAMKAPEEARVAELRFTYLGATREQVPLQSGELRRQVGLKLRAKDGCNVVYVMWRIEPKAGLVVSVKHNPGKERSDDCGNGGYRTVKPRSKEPVPELEPGDDHTLRAELEGRALTVRVDGRSVWEGTLPEEVLTFDGPVGLRSDNGRFQVELRTHP
ncbi:hypothetical protein JRI60_23740 [Archangium violaceum]|uniref:hypothetical protein n=1 Tax=Archangium violaceum TaxID=83451 RepID=UPI001950286C|nr:hypothetical protein [Archangium violaceum]QRO01813.1 hypothetical protein JRI60_23740 [Archangium violaceum]